MPFLKIALIHAAIHHKKTEANRAALLDAFHQAGAKNASMVIAPELALSGNFFSSRQEIAPYVETENGPTLTELATIARTYSIFICIGLAEHDLHTGIFYNSAFVLDPSGIIVCRYRKITPGNKWACPGNPKENNTFETPWGRVGLLIGTDTYGSLLPRTTGLRGANFLVIPSNWAPDGINPKEVWRARAVENGISLVACNRTGMELRTDYTQAQSVAFDSQGKTLLSKSNGNSRIFRANIPLNADCRFKAGQRLRRLAHRNALDTHACYLPLSSDSNLTSYFDLPPAGPLQIFCSVPPEGKHPLEDAEKTMQHPAAAQDVLHVLPAWMYDDVSLDRLWALCAVTGRKAVARKTTAGGFHMFYFDGARPAQHWEVNTKNPSKSLQMFCVDCGPAHILIATCQLLSFPEYVLAAAKQGCDLIVISEQDFSAENRLLAAVRTIDNTAIAVCATNGGGIWMMPEADMRWEETLAEPGHTCTYVFNTHRTRRKHFQDRVDFETLFGAYAT